MAFAIDPNEPWVWTPDDSTGEKFLIRQITPRLLREIKRKSRDPNATDDDLVALVLAGWVDLVDRRGEPVEFKPDKNGNASEESLSYISLERREEIINVARKGPQTLETDLKNSPSPSS